MTKEQIREGCFGPDMEWFELPANEEQFRDIPSRDNLGEYDYFITEDEKEQAGPCRPHDEVWVLRCQWMPLYINPSVNKLKLANGELDMRDCCYYRRKR